jgi:hypothetical protein
MQGQQDMVHASFGTLPLAATVFAKRMTSVLLAALKSEEYGPEIQLAVPDWWLDSYVGDNMAFAWAA